MQKQKLILIGGGGHCKACIDVIESTYTYDIIGILDQPQLVGQKVLGYPIIGTDQDIVKKASSNIQFLITIGQTKSASTRVKLYKMLNDFGVNIATVISPLAHISKYASIAKGTIVMHYVNVNASSLVGENCILNNGCNIEHDSVIGNHAHISTNAIINGNCKIGCEVFIGSNATIANQIEIVQGAVIGAGATVVKNIMEKGIFIGNPARKFS